MEGDQKRRETNIASVQQERDDLSDVDLGHNFRGKNGRHKWDVTEDMF